jgi:hypothetical protein
MTPIKEKFQILPNTLHSNGGNSEKAKGFDEIKRMAEGYDKMSKGEQNEFDETLKVLNKAESTLETKERHLSHPSRLDRFKALTQGGMAQVMARKQQHADDLKQQIDDLKSDLKQKALKAAGPPAVSTPIYVTQVKMSEQLDREIKQYAANHPVVSASESLDVGVGEDDLGVKVEGQAMNDPTLGETSKGFEDNTLNTNGNTKEGEPKLERTQSVREIMKENQVVKRTKEQLKKLGVDTDGEGGSPAIKAKPMGHL